MLTEVDLMIDGSGFDAAIPSSIFVQTNSLPTPILKEKTESRVFV